MVNLPNKEDLEHLLKEKDGTKVSIYMPTLRAGRETRQNAIGFKNRLRQAEKGIQTAVPKAASVDDLLAPAKRLQRNSLFWQHQSDGLAVFLSAGTFLYYCVPLNFKEMTVVNDRFYIKPLLAVFSGEEQFYLLALSQKNTRLFEGNRYSLRPIEIKGLPKNLSQTLGYDNLEEHQQFHTRAPSRGGRRDAIFHGHGGAADVYKVNILRFFQAVDKALHDPLGNKQLPLVLAGAEPLLPIYRKASHNPFLVAEGIPVNPDELDDENLHALAWKAVEPQFFQSREKALAAFDELSPTDRVLADLKDIVPAAHYGRVGVLFVARNAQRWGIFNSKENAVIFEPKPKPTNSDLLDLAAVRTLLNGGTVYVMEPEQLPAQGPAAAILRY